jgi:Sigma-70, region 4
LTGGRLVTGAPALPNAHGAKVTDHWRERSNDLFGTIAPEPKCPEDELCRIAQALEHGRNANLPIDLWGWSGSNPRTLDSVGRKLGLTRERVRQIEARALRLLSKHGFDIPYLRAAIGFLRKETPGLDSELAKKLSEPGISRISSSIWSVTKAAEIFREDWPFQIISF